MAGLPRRIIKVFAPLFCYVCLVEWERLWRTKDIVDLCPGLSDLNQTFIFLADPLALGYHKQSIQLQYIVLAIYLYAAKNTLYFIGNSKACSRTSSWHHCKSR